MKTVTLFGGHFHRQKIEISDYPYQLNMEIPPKIHLQKENMVAANPYDRLVTYIRHTLTIGEFEIENVYLKVGIEPEEFIKNIVLDYIS